MVDKKRLLLLEDADYEEIWSGDCDRVPIKDLRWDESLEGFYPIPPVFQWLSPQDEINEAREQTRSFVVGSPVNSRHSKERLNQMKLRNLPVVPMELLLPLSRLMLSRLFRIRNKGKLLKMPS